MLEEKREGEEWKSIREKTKGRVRDEGAEREDEIDVKESRGKLVFSGDKNVNLKIRR